MPLKMFIEDMRLLLLGSAAALAIIIITILVLGMTTSFLGATKDTDQQHANEVQARNVIGYYIRRSDAQLKTEEQIREQIQVQRAYIEVLEAKVRAMGTEGEDAQRVIAVLTRLLRDARVRLDAAQYAQPISMAPSRSNSATRYSTQDQTTETNPQQENSSPV